MHQWKRGHAAVEGLKLELKLIFYDNKYQEYISLGQKARKLEL